LKEEYFHIQRVIQTSDDRALAIKGWSVTFSLVALVGAFVSHAPVALLVGTLRAGLFWLIEGQWKTIQYAHYERAGRIERHFVGERKEPIPLQLGALWYKRFKAGGTRRLIQITLRPSVAMPHALISLACLSMLCTE
jgi:hypothetical protein